MQLPPQLTLLSGYTVQFSLQLKFEHAKKYIYII